MHSLHRFILCLVVGATLPVAVIHLSRTPLPSPFSRFARPSKLFTAGSPQPLQHRLRTNLGRVPRGAKASYDFVVQNPNSAKAVVIDRIDSTCECITITPGQAEITGGTTAHFIVSFDFSDEPQFVGSLALTVHGYGIMGDILFTTHFELEVTQ